MGKRGMARAKKLWVSCSQRLGGGDTDREKHQCRLDVICSDTEELTDVPALQNEGRGDRKAWC
jgi:hypothetical protein